MCAFEPNHSRSVDDGKSKELALEIYDYIRTTNEACFKWAKRGLEIFRLITNRKSENQNAYERFFQHVHLGPPVDAVGLAKPSPDLIVLVEYDVHFGSALCPDLDYLGTGKPCSFPAAMNAEGYHALFFGSPRVSESGHVAGSGIGVFAKSRVFDVAQAKGAAVAEASVFNMADAQGGSVTRHENGTLNIVVACGAREPYGLQVNNFDLHSKSHKRGSMKGAGLEELSVNDRKNVAMCTLEFRHEVRASHSRMHP